jgi:hypothetical protein
VSRGWAAAHHTALSDHPPLTLMWTNSLRILPARSTAARSRSPVSMLVRMPTAPPSIVNLVGVWSVGQQLEVACGAALVAEAATVPGSNREALEISTAELKFICAVLCTGRPPD